MTSRRQVFNGEPSDATKVGVRRLNFLDPERWPLCLIGLLQANDSITSWPCEQLYTRWARLDRRGRNLNRTCKAGNPRKDMFEECVRLRTLAAESLPGQVIWAAAAK